MLLLLLLVMLLLWHINDVLLLVRYGSGWISRMMLRLIPTDQIGLLMLMLQCLQGDTPL